MDPHKVIMRKVEGDRSLEVLKLLAESIGQPREPPHLIRIVKFCLSM